MPLKMGGKLFCIGMTAVFLYSCGMKKTNDTNSKDVLVPVIPSVDVSTTAHNGILYVNNAMQTSFSNVPFLKNSMKFISQSMSLYTATGDGGLGADLDDSNDLKQYEGIPVSIAWSNVDAGARQITVASSGDGNCANIFTFDSQKNLIRIDNSSINTLLSCHLKVSANGVSNGKFVKDEREFNVVLNPTLSFYASNNDTTFRYLKQYSSLSDIKLIARWLKDKNVQSSGLNLKYDSKVIKGDTNPDNINALTGAQSVTSINLSNTNLRDLKALLHFKNLQKINISGTHVEPKDIAILKDLKTLQSLNISNMYLKDVKTVTDNLTNLEELDISGNTQISDLEDIQNLKNLRILKASNIGLTDLKKFDGMTQVTDLDISKNDLSKTSLDDVQTLVNLYNLKALTVSETHISDEFLNSYFDAISSRNTLKKFVDASKFDRDGDVSEEVCRSQINIFDDIQNIRKVTSLEYIDLHGNGCNVADGFKQIGLTDTAFFSRMNDLKYLDISDTPVKDLSGIAHAKNLQTLHLVYHPVEDERKFVNEGGISMNATACVSYFGEHNPLASECDALGQGTNEFQEFIQAGNYSFTIPENVFKIHIKGCSSGDGGQGGRGYEGTNRFWIGDDTPYNPPHPPCGRGGCLSVGKPVYENRGAGPGEFGHPGSQGQITKVTTLGDENFFSTTNEPYYAAYNSNCGGGAGGNGLSQGASGASKRVIESDFKVTPGQVLQIFVPTGGAGGIGGAGSGGGCTQPPFNGGCGDHGANGGQGNPGTDGYLKITWYK